MELEKAPHALREASKEARASSNSFLAIPPSWDRWTGPVDRRLCVPIFRWVCPVSECARSGNQGPVCSGLRSFYMTMAEATAEGSRQIWRHLPFVFVKRIGACVGAFARTTNRARLRDNHLASRSIVDCRMQVTTGIQGNRPGRPAPVAMEDHSDKERTDEMCWRSTPLSPAFQFDFRCQSSWIAEQLSSTIDAKSSFAVKSGA